MAFNFVKSIVTIYGSSATYYLLPLFFSFNTAKNQALSEANLLTCQAGSSNPQMHAGRKTTD